MACDNNNIDNLHLCADILTQISAIYSKYAAEYMCIGEDDIYGFNQMAFTNTPNVLNQFITKEILQIAI